MYCKKCGTYNSGDSLVCNNCGDYLVTQYKNAGELSENIVDKNLYTDNNNKYIKSANKRDENKKIKNDNKKDKVKYKKIKVKQKRIKDSILKRDKVKKPRNKDNNKNNTYREKEVIVKSSISEKLTILFLLVLVIILVSICSILGLYILKDKVVRMPNITGLNVTEAREILDSNSITYEIKEKDDETSINKVIDQNPIAGTYIFKNRIVEIVIGTKKDNTDSNENTLDNKELIVDNYVGMKIEDATNILNKLNIKYEIVEIDIDGDKDIIVKQNPSKDSKIDKDMMITLYVPINKNENTSSDADDSTDTLNN